MPLNVLRLGRGDIEAVTDVLVESFRDYPVMRFVLGRATREPPDEHYNRRLRTLVHFFVTARILRDEVILGIEGGERLDAAALVSWPRMTGPAELDQIRQRVWNKLGDDARTRYERFGATTKHFEVPQPHIHLNMIGVRREAQGRGLGGALMEAVHRLSVERDDSEGVGLTTEDPDNVSLYERSGYRLLDRLEVAPGLTTWGFYREN